jgi:GDP-4-dehydro-6-deoxy-D-mannose reductase
MRVLITGVSGFLGRHLAAELVRRGGQVVGTALAHEQALHGLAVGEVSVLDVTDEAAVRRLVDAVRPEVVVHLAGLSHVGASWQRVADYFRANVLGCEFVTTAARALGAKVLVPSSAEVYGPVPAAEQPIVEDRPLAPSTPYALTKAAAERLALPAGAVVVRCFNLVGPGQAPQFALPSFARQLASIRAGRREALLRVGNLAAVRDFVHVQDACDAVVCMIERGQAGTVYNLASGVAVSIREALDRLCRLAELEVEVVEDPELMRPLDVPLVCGDSSRLQALGWAPGRGLDRALADLWASTWAAEAAT